MTYRTSLIRPAILTLLALSTPTAAQTPDEASIEQTLIRILERRPELIQQALARAQQAAVRAQQDRLQDGLRAAMPRILASKIVPRSGPSKGQMTVVSFFDYNCNFCRQFENQTKQPLVRQRPDIQVYYVHAPILNDGSRRLAEIAAAAHLQGRFLPVHEWLMRLPGPVATPEAANGLLEQLIRETGLDAKRLQDDLANGRARAQVDEHIQIAQAAHLSATPLVYAGSQAIPGAIPLEPLLHILRTQTPPPR